jgi:hypothetical protein
MERWCADTREIVCVSSAVIEEIKRIVKQSEIIKEDDSKWPQKNKDGRQELEIRLGGDHISFEVRILFCHIAMSCHSARLMPL